MAELRSLSPPPAEQREPAAGHRLGLALSGGGSRAAAFHRGTLRGLARVRLADRVDVVSTVSGGSVFGGAWMAARAHGVGDEEFLDAMARELRRGFIARSIRPALLRTFLPGFSRTDLIAGTLDLAFFHGATLDALPASPRLCVNTSVLNHGQVGKFSREGFTTRDVAPGDAPGSRVVPLPGFRLARAVAASAAFPIGLPPLVLKRTRDLGHATFSGDLRGLKRLALSDGGVLENLGVQTLLQSERFWTWDLVVSDAGTRQKPWRPGPWKPLKSALIALLAGGALDEVLSLMNDKENRWMRQHTHLALEESWFADGLRRAASGVPPAEGLRVALDARRPYPRRRLLFLRVNQSLESLVEAIVPWRLVELWMRSHGGSAPPGPLPETYAKRRTFLAECGVELSAADAVYAELGGADGVRRMNRVTTSFSGLAREQVEGLALHAEWQVLATHALYWT